VFTGERFSFDGWVEIDAYECNITGPDVEISCHVMALFPDDKRLKLDGDVTLTSNEGGLRMDSLEICYDELGVKELCAQGNVRVDLTLVLDEGIFGEVPVDEGETE
jgi:hypothetical protein